MTALLKDANRQGVRDHRIVESVLTTTHPQKIKPNIGDQRLSVSLLRFPRLRAVHRFVGVRLSRDFYALNTAISMESCPCTYSATIQQPTL